LGGSNIKEESEVKKNATIRILEMEKKRAGPYGNIKKLMERVV